MSITKKVTCWLRGQMPLNDIVVKLKQHQLTVFSCKELKQVIRMFAILAICPSVSAKFASAFSRTRAHKRNILQKLVLVVKQFNEHRHSILCKIYENIPGSLDKYHDILKTIEHSNCVQCTLLHRGGEEQWAAHANEMLLTCSENATNKRSWIIPTNSVELFHSFFIMRHFHSIIEITAFWWMKKRRSSKECFEFETLLEVSNLFMKSDLVREIEESYRKSFQTLQNVLFTYI
jgi:hypothetical protein